MVQVGGTTVNLKRGECILSQRTLAERWKWERGRVRSFLNKLKKRGKIMLEWDSCLTHLSANHPAKLTICDYDRFCMVSPTSEPTSQPSIKRKNLKKEESNPQRELLFVIEGSRSESPPEPPRKNPPDDWPENYGEVFWAAYPRKRDKQDAIKKLAELRKKRIVSFAALMKGVEQYAESERNSEPRHIKYPSTWINKGCWTNEPEQSTRIPNLKEFLGG
jgi:hypothetical protein